VLPVEAAIYVSCSILLDKTLVCGKSAISLRVRKGQLSDRMSKTVVFGNAVFG
jgi:hypothetical protein